MDTAARLRRSPDQRPQHLLQTWFNLSVVMALILAIVVVSAVLSAHDRFLLLERAAAVILALLPGFLYVRFMESRGPAVWNEYVFNLNRLGIDKPENLPIPLGTAQPAAPWTGQHDQNIYIQKFDAHYGRTNRRRWQALEPDAEKGGSELAPGMSPEEHDGRSVLRELDTLVPVLLTTLVVALGAVLLIVGPPFLAPGTPPLLDEVRAGFLGSYFFILQFFVRRFFQNDLKPSAYLAATERLVVVPIIILALHVLLPADRQAYIPVAFCVGVFPVVGLRAINAVAARVLRGFVPTVENNYPLSDLDGMTIWYEARLIEEAIEDMQSLVTANMVDLMLHTRIPVGRLVDWIDQSHLCLHLPPVPKGKSTAGGERVKLRRFGVRTATDLEDAFAGYGEPATISTLEPADRECYFKGLKYLLNQPGEEPSLTLSVLRCLSCEPTLNLVRNWKRS